MHRLLKLLCVFFTAVSLMACAPYSDDLMHPAIQRASQALPKLDLSYLERAGEGGAIVVFIHGTPGQAEAFSQYLAESWLLEDAARLISIDRPAWGQSSIEHEQPAMNLAEQSRVLTPWFEQLKQDEAPSHIVLVGHSLGGSLVIQLLADQPQLYAGALILAGSVDPALSQPRWYHRLARNPLVKMLIGGDFARSNVEMLSLGDDLQRVSQRYSDITAPLTMVQGEKDFLVNKDNAVFAKAQWPHAKVIELADTHHFLPWGQQALIVEEIKALIAGAKQPLND